MGRPGFGEELVGEDARNHPSRQTIFLRSIPVVWIECEDRIDYVKSGGGEKAAIRLT